MCRYDIRDHDPRTAISNPYNTDVTNSDIPTPSPRRGRSNSEDGNMRRHSSMSDSDDGVESVVSNSSSNNSRNLQGDISGNNSVNDEHIDELVSNVIGEITNTLTHEVTAYLQQTFDLSNITHEQLNDISFNFATVTEAVISTNDENASDVD